MWQVGNIVHYIWYKMYVLVVFYCLRCNTIPTIGFRQVINANLRTCCTHCASKEAGHKMNIRFKALPPSPSQPAQPRQGARFSTRMIIGVFCSNTLTLLLGAIVLIGMKYEL